MILSISLLVVLVLHCTILTTYPDAMSDDGCLPKRRKCDALVQGDMLPFGVVEGFKLHKLVWYLEHRKALAEETR